MQNEDDTAHTMILIHVHLAASMADMDEVRKEAG